MNQQPNQLTMQLTMVVNYVLDKNVQLRTEMDTVLQHCTNQKVKTLRLIACIYIYIYILCDFASFDSVGRRCGNAERS